MNLPNVELELNLIKQGYPLIAGVDEVGRGPWAGPLVACAVILPITPNFLLEKLNDSKKLSPGTREDLNKKIRNLSISIGIGEVSVALLDKIGVGKANKLAFLSALLNLEIFPNYIILDYLSISTKDLDLLLELNPSPEKIAKITKLENLIKNCQKNIKFGDSISASIAAASIVAKTYRDNLMREIHPKFPQYNFKNNKGYPSKEHIQALKEWGPCEIHRKSFAPIRLMGSSVI